MEAGNHTAGCRVDYDVDPIMSDIPIRSPGIAVSLPAADEVKTSVRAPPSKTFPYNRRRLLIGAGGAALLALILGLALGLGGQQTEPPERNAQFESVLSYLNRSGVSKIEDMRNSNTPQAKAIAWLAEQDSRNLAVPSHSISSDIGYRYVCRYILALLWFSTAGAEWKLQLDWLSGKDICNWNAHLGALMERTGESIVVPVGAFCGTGSGKLASLHLDMNNLKGELPSEIGLLSSLGMLNLEGNKLEGSLPEQVCMLESLKGLLVLRNNLIDQLPPCLSNMTKLQTLAVSSNYFRGDLPDLSLMTDMTYLLLDDNTELTGNVTSTFQRMTHLKLLYLDDTSLSGHVNDNFLSANRNLSQIDISGCDFYGTFPPHFFSMPVLEVLDVHDNNLYGTLPALIPNSTALKFLAINENRFNGSIPDSIANAQLLVHLDLSNNQFQGDLPDTVARLPRLQRLYLAENSFNQGPIPSDFQHLVQLRELSLKSTNRYSTIPAFLGKLTHLTLLDLDNNDFNGTVPTELGDLSDLQFVLLNRNERLEGEIPRSFENLSALRGAFLDRTSLNGSLDGLCDLPAFSEPHDDSDGSVLMSADCGGSASAREVSCRCCAYCCIDGKASSCHENYGVPNVDPEWQFGFDRFEYEFGNTLFFQVRDYMALNP